MSSIRPNVGTHPHHSARSALIIVALCTMALLSGLARAADRTNVPLRNWGGFALPWHWTYDAVKKLVLAGLADRAVLNTSSTFLTPSFSMRFLSRSSISC